MANSASLLLQEIHIPLSLQKEIHICAKAQEQEDQDHQEQVAER
ncbi:MAG TPA: hypothetical protein VH593_02240 [Ktedonobacteraceae bacterium]|jgi:hypothetical protein